MKKIKQKHYGDLEVDGTERDVVQIWCINIYSQQVIHIERANLQELIDILKEELKNK